MVPNFDCSSLSDIILIITKNINKESSILFTGKVGSKWQDTVMKKLSIHPKGFPLSSSFGGLITSKSKNKFSEIFKIEIPEYVKDSMVSSVKLYTSPISNLFQVFLKINIKH